ncbi:fanconi-associated nuclease 1-like [Stegodyphus dumicola]|uniref:fanconi-associated nuclease 1-like n=1 Tax=Stegodyphus dumicola TaxID=202533 RepID=UPI0015A79912|nr:fanconi-associated nuclease 1-like [Stegodyphus dumicola]
MKKTNILDYFKVQGEVDSILCPACGNKLAKSKLNQHLDTSCCSTINSSSITVKNVLPYKTSHENFRIKSSNFSTSSSSRLSLKKQKRGINDMRYESIQSKSLNRREQIVNSEVCDEVIVLDSDCTADSESISQETSLKGFKRQNIIHERDDINSEINLSGKKQVVNREVSDEVIVLDNDHTTDSESVLGETSLKRFKKENTVHRRDDVNREINLSGKKQIVNCEVSDGVIIIDNDQAVKSICQGTPGKRFIKQNTMDGMTDVSSEINLIRKEGKVIFEVSEDDFVSGREEVTVYENVCHEISEKYFIEPIVNKSQNTNEMNLSPDAASDVIEILKDVKDSLNYDVFSELSDSENKELKDDGKPYMPYYIANFKHILNTVINEHDNDILFNDEDRVFIKAFESVSGAAQKLYVRLFQRKYKWLRPSKINYPDITNNPKEILEELVKNNLVDSGLEGIELETGLNLLSLIEVKSLSKQFNFSSGKSKTEIIGALLKHCRQHKSVFFMNGKNNITNTMLKK